MEPAFVTGESVLMIGKTLVVSDLHIGIEYEFRKSGINIPSRTDEMISRIESLLNTTNAKRLMILGDLKHRIPGISRQEERDIPRFINHFSGELEIVMGNHDPGIEKFCQEHMKLHPSDGVLVHNCYLIHGHAWPNTKFLEADYLIMGHIHPQIEFKDKLGYRWIEPVWVRTRLNKENIEDRYKKNGNPEVIVMPAFNPFSGGKILNNKEYDKTDRFISPITRHTDMHNARIFLVDGTFLGNLQNI